MNPFAAGPLCKTCGDVRLVAKRRECHSSDLVPCPDCGGDFIDKKETESSKERYAHFRSRRWAEQQVPPGICELDLSDKELETLRALKAQNPNVSKITVLSWMEGQRYDPTKDPEFLAEARVKFKEWRNR